ncbi:MAG: phytochelatin synthase family protein [Rhizobiales bacterium]|nr:phytochelatin synthase family protein [Hyphomicrobiales bacterium]
MNRKPLLLAVALAWLSFSPSYLRADTLPLPPALVSSASDQGQSLLIGAESRKAYFPLADHFVTQLNQAFCGVASMTMVLNASGLPAPAVPEFDPYRTFTQDNVLTPATESVLPVDTIKKMGITLDQLGGMLSTYPLTVNVRHAADSSADSFRKEASAALNTPGNFVIINYLRKAIGQEKGGHISPLAAYDADEDRFLILDVARYKYPPVWVKTADLYGAMNTQDSDNNNQTRGYLLIARK